MITPGTIGNIIDTPQDLLTALGSIAERCRDLSDFCEQTGGRPVDKNAARNWVDKKDIL